MAGQVSKEQLLAKLQASKRPVSPRQLERWWKAGHVERPRREHVKGVRGSLSLFSTRAFAQVAALYDARHAPLTQAALTDRRLDERAFLAWWSSEKIAQDPRRLLLDFSAPMMSAIERVRSYKPTTIVNGTGDDEDRLFETCETYFHEHPPERSNDALYRVLFRNLGKRGDDLFSVLVTMASAALGSMPPIEPSHHPGEPSLASLVLRAYGIADFKCEHTSDDDLSNLLNNVSFFADRKGTTDFILSLSDDELETARRCARTFLEGMPVIFESQNILFGKKGTAKLLHVFSRMLTTPLRAVVVVGVAWLLRKIDPANVLKLMEQVEEGAPKARALCMAARAFPEYRGLFSHKNLAKLAELPEQKKREILAVLKNAVA